eukprot:scpid88521/ scgid4619/ Cyclin-C
MCVYMCVHLCMHVFRLSLTPLMWTAALHIACVVHGQNCQQWFSELAVDFQQILEVTRDIMDMYRTWESCSMPQDIPRILQKLKERKAAAKASSSNGGSNSATTLPAPASLEDCIRLVAD